jgi:hypothetical protein
LTYLKFLILMRLAEDYKTYILLSFSFNPQPAERSPPFLKYHSIV